MKDPLVKTKAVLRHLPPAMAEAALVEQIDRRFAGRYNWVCFRPGRNSQKNQRHSRAYIDLKKAEDVLEFAEFFNGHIFVNEKGAQFKAMVEYAPSQCVPKQMPKKDGREGTILKDPEYLEFIELLAKPVEHLPSAEIQLERKEAERAGAAKETFIVTPLMDFVRQKRAAKSGFQRVTISRRLRRRCDVVSTNNCSPSSKRGSEKQRGHTLMYVSRDGTKNGNRKEKSTYILVSRRDDHLSDKNVAVALASVSSTDAREDEAAIGINKTTSGVPVSFETGKKRAVLLKGKETDNSLNATASVTNAAASSSLKQIQRQESNGGIIKRILSHKDKHPPQPPISHSNFKDHVPSGSPTASISDNYHGLISIRDEHMENKGRPDRGVWASPCRSIGSYFSEETLSKSSLSAQISSDSLESVQATEVKSGINDVGLSNGRSGHENSVVINDMPSNHVGTKLEAPSSSRGAELKNLGNGRVNLAYLENSSNKHVGLRGNATGLKEANSSLNFAVGKPFKRGLATGIGSLERQAWVQKSGSAS